MMTRWKNSLVLGKPPRPRARNSLSRSLATLDLEWYQGVGDGGGKSENRNLDCAGHACRGADPSFRLGVVVGRRFAVTEFAPRLPLRHR
jgi:hypothetical protein